MAELYAARLEDIAEAVSTEIGALLWLAQQRQVSLGLVHIQKAIAITSTLSSGMRGTAEVVCEAIGVVGLITPWNWPLNQIVAKVASALAACCTIVLKSSEIAPLDARIFVEIVHDAGAPAGVINMLCGDGKVVGGALSRHPGVDMVSITGSTRAGIDVAINAAPTIKRVTQELGGKSPNVILDDADLKTAVFVGVIACMMNSGQTCTAPTRMLGPISNRRQYERVQQIIEIGIREGARIVVAGGPGRPEGLEMGFYIRPRCLLTLTTR